ncbi:MAG: sarcosine oxidase subunit gamma [Nocardioidaceae bacterium]
MSAITPAAPVTLADGWAVSGRRSDAALRLIDCSPLTKVTVRADHDGKVAGVIGVPLGRAARPSWGADVYDGPVLAAGSGPGTWLALAAPGAQPQVEEWLDGMAADAAELVTVTDLTHGLTMVRLGGTRARETLAKECGVDLRDDVCPPGTALRTAVSGVAAGLIRDDQDSTESYLVHCERSTGQYLFDSLLDAGAEFGIEVDGFVSPGI